MKKLILLSIILLSLFVMGVEQDVTVNILAVPEMFLGNESGEDSEIDDDGIVYATLNNNDAGICEIKWEDSFGDIDPGLTEASHTYYSIGEKAVEYRCGSSEEDFVTIQDGIFVSKAPCLIQLNMPEEEVFYDSKKVLIDTQINERVVDLDYSIDGGRDRRLCKNCGAFNRTKNFKDGEHDLTVKANDRELPICEKSVSFTVDSTAPKIKKTEPKRNKYTNGSFKVEYDELFLDMITLNYGNDSSMRAETREDCPSGEKQICEMHVNLSYFDGSEIEYSFILKDTFFTTEMKRPISINVDTTAPKITKLDFTQDGKRIEFDVLISEEVALEYFDESDPKAKWKNLCRNCDNYDKKKSFSTGEHDLMIRAMDKAQNSDIEEISFVI